MGPALTQSLDLPLSPHLPCYHYTCPAITAHLLLAVIGIEPPAPSPSQQILKDATRFFSRPMPNLARIIPAMDHIEETLSTSSLDMSNDPAICAALAIARKTLNRYYGLTDSSEVYRIAMGELHS